MRRLYQRCKLVHADLSEYNLLYYKDEVWVIDVSQAVENDHPMALDFLRRDCSIMQEFFSKKLERVLTTQDTFSFVTDLSIEDEEEEAVFAFLVQNLYNKTSEEIQREKQDDEVFKSIYIPRTLQDLDLDDIDRLKRNNQVAMFNKLTGIQDETAKANYSEEIAQLKDAAGSHEDDTVKESPAAADELTEIKEEALVEGKTTDPEESKKLD